MENSSKVIIDLEPNGLKLTVSKEIYPYLRDYEKDFFEPLQGSLNKKCAVIVTAVRLLFTFIVVLGNRLPSLHEIKIVALELGGQRLDKAVQALYRKLFMFYYEDILIEDNYRLRVPITSAQDVMDLYLIAERVLARNEYGNYINKSKYENYIVSVKKIYSSVFKSDFSLNAVRRNKSLRDLTLNYDISYMNTDLLTIVFRFLDREFHLKSEIFEVLKDYYMSTKNRVNHIVSDSKTPEINTPIEIVTHPMESFDVFSDLIPPPLKKEVHQESQVSELIVDSLLKDLQLLTKKVSHLELKVNYSEVKIKTLESYLKEYVESEKSRILSKSKKLDNLYIDETIKTVPIQDDLIF